MNLFGRFVVAISKLKVIWKEWDIRSFIVASFVFQLILILIAPFRKRSSSRYVRFSTWISYLMADWVAAQAVGLIASATQGSDSAESDLFGMWAQFLLIHLGGPDTITALALEDNELWIRTALHLGTQAYATLGILVRSVRQSSLWVATVLMFLAGVTKYMERVTSLHHGRLMDIDDDPYDKYIKNKLVADGCPEDIEEQTPLSKEAMVRDSYWLFQAYKSLYADIPLKDDVRNAARKYFLKRKSGEAYEMVAIQLNFMYEAMYTKMGVVHKKPWRVLRGVVLLLQLASLVIWCLRDKRGFLGYDVRVTYALLIGAIAVDLLGFLRIQFSDWNVALRLNEESEGKCLTSPLYNKIVSKCDCNALRNCRKMWSRLQDLYLSRRRWSMHICLYGGISLDNWLDRVKMLLHLYDNEHHRREVELDWEIRENWDFIFEMLTKPCNQLSYKLPGSVTLNMNQLLLRALPIHTLDYRTVLQYWCSLTTKKYFDKSHSEFVFYFNVERYLTYLMAFQQGRLDVLRGSV